MKRKRIYFVVTVLFLLVLAACSGGSSSNESMSGAESGASKEMVAADSGKSQNQSTESTQSNSGTEEAKTELKNARGDRMVIYNANITITVQQFEKARDQIEKLINSTGGYVVESSTAQTEEERQRGSVTARIPQSKFNSFLDQIEGLAKNVEHRNVNGHDVTEEYVDLESRLKAKQAVQKRLQAFLKNAENTEDLLDISESLARVQEEIEHVKGRMQYLENQSAFSTVTVHLSEDNTSIKQSEDLNTWERTEQAFINSVNGLLSFFSFLVVFLVGFSPVLIMIALLTGVVYYLYKRRKKKEDIEK